jgi:N-acetylglucosaminyldiphosphoundecaprenol N-acetyl-beta-D-mannosaminyltransferase
LAEEAAKCGWRVFFLGAAPGVALNTAKILSEKHAGLKVAGTHSGSPAPEDEDYIVNLIRDSNADLVFVAFGAPKQDLWLYHNLKRTGAKVGMGVGGSFDFITGVQKRAPIWVQRLGLEWLFRLVQEPRRWRRQLALPKFVWLILHKRDI